jgi:uncharacterized protein YndB with AHSA1/START domain
MVNVIGIVVVVLLAGVLGFAATRPDSFRIERAITVDAPAERIFALINDFGRWRAWSPYETKDPEMQRTLSGATGGEGAVYEWAGNKDVGRGRMEIVHASPPSRITIKLDFLAPFEAHNTAVFTLTPRGDATDVRWAMHGPSPFMGKLMSVFINLDRLIGRDFETGLARLKAIAEKPVADRRGDGQTFDRASSGPRKE